MPRRRFAQRAGQDQYAGSQAQFGYRRPQPAAGQGATTAPVQGTPANPETTTAQPYPSKSAQAEPEPADAAAHAAASADIQPGSKILVNIDKSTQEMTVFVDGVEHYSWKVRPARAGTNAVGTYTPTSMNEIWYSKQWDNSPMPHAVFFMKDGHAIHGTHEVKNLGKPASHGCVRLAPENAATLYAMVEKTGMENTQVVLSGEAQGAQPRVASPSPNYQYQYQYPYQRRGQPVPPWFNPGQEAQVEPDQQPQRRRGLFGRRWFQQDQGAYYGRNYYQQRGYGY